MKKLYLDCDGVILDTINKSYAMIREMDIDIEKEEEIKRFYQTIDWKKLIIDSGEINDSIKKIRELEKHFDIEILTHTNSNEEIREKKDYFSRELPGINVISVPKNIDKCDMVSPKGAILVDDYAQNLKKWEEKGGIPIKFSDSGKDCDYTTITDLLELLEINFNHKVKAKE